MTVNPVYKTRRWARVRMQVLERDGWLCRIGLPGCTTGATQVDHIVPLADGGAPYELSSLRSACRSCNVSAGNTARVGRRTVRHHPMWDDVVARVGVEGCCDPTRLTEEERIKLLGYPW